MYLKKNHWLANGMRFKNVRHRHSRYRTG
jgi:hypothetical protein